MLPNATKFIIDEALFLPKSTRNLLSFDDIYWNGCDTKSITINSNKYLNIVFYESGKIQVLERLPKLPTGLHYTYIHVIESHMAVKEKFYDPLIINLWHDRLGHPGSVMMRRIIENSHGHPLKGQRIPQSNEMSCTTYSLEKLILRPSPSKI